MTIERLVIVADAHLGGVPGEVQEAFLAFLDRVRDEGDGLLINGDLFAFFYAYRRVIPRSGIQVVTRLAELARKIPVLMTGGNHDRWGGTFWDRDLAIRFSPNELLVPWSSGRCVAIHGDGIAEAGLRGKILHTIFRNRITSTVYHLIHPDVGFWLVDRLSGGLADSRDPRRADAAAARQKIWAEQRMQADPGIALLTMGHTHRAAVVEVAPGRWYVNPGAWMEGYTYAVAGPQGVELKQFRG